MLPAYESAPQFSNPKTETAGCSVTPVHFHTKDSELSAAQNISSSLILFVNAVLAHLTCSQTFQHPHTLKGSGRNIHVVISVLNSGDETRTQDVHKFSKNIGAISKLLAPEWHSKQLHTKGP